MKPSIESITKVSEISAKAPSPEERITLCLSMIPKGKVTNYGELARRAGLTNGARLTARTLKHLPSDTRLPWHRVIKSTGHIAFPEGSEGYLEQCKRLQAEAVIIDKGRVSRRFFW